MALTYRAFQLRATLANKASAGITVVVCATDRFDVPAKRISDKQFPHPVSNSRLADADKLQTLGTILSQPTPKLLQDTLWAFCD